MDERGLTKDAHSRNRFALLTLVNDESNELSVNVGPECEVMQACALFSQDPEHRIDLLVEKAQALASLSEQSLQTLLQHNFFEFLGRCLAKYTYTVEQVKGIIFELAKVDGDVASQLIFGGAFDFFWKKITSTGITSSVLWKTASLDILLRWASETRVGRVCLIQKDIIQKVRDFVKVRANSELNIRALSTVSWLTECEDALEYKDIMKELMLFVTQNWNVYRTPATSKLFVFVARHFSVPQEEFTVPSFVRDLFYFLKGDPDIDIVDRKIAKNVLTFVRLRAQYGRECVAFFEAGIVEFIESLPREGITEREKFDLYSVFVSRIPQMPGFLVETELGHSIIEQALMIMNEGTWQAKESVACFVAALIIQCPDVANQEYIREMTHILVEEIESWSERGVRSVIDLALALLRSEEASGETSFRDYLISQGIHDRINPYKGSIQASEVLIHSLTS